MLIVSSETELNAYLQFSHVFGFYNNFCWPIISIFVYEALEREHHGIDLFDVTVFFF